eukprot:2334547-Pyramimonas_sp.AAC.1
MPSLGRNGAVVLKVMPPQVWWTAGTGGSAARGSGGEAVGEGVGMGGVGWGNGRSVGDVGDPQRFHVPPRCLHPLPPLSEEARSGNVQGARDW